MSGQNYIFSCLLYMVILQKHSSYITEAIFLLPASPQVVSMENCFCIISLVFVCKLVRWRGCAHAQRDRLHTGRRSFCSVHLHSQQNSLNGLRLQLRQE